VSASNDSSRSLAPLVRRDARRRGVERRLRESSRVQAALSSDGNRDAPRRDGVPFVRLKVHPSPSYIFRGHRVAPGNRVTLANRKAARRCSARMCAPFRPPPHPLTPPPSPAAAEGGRRGEARGAHPRARPGILIYQSARRKFPPPPPSLNPRPGGVGIYFRLPICSDSRIFYTAFPRYIAASADISITGIAREL